LDPGAAPVKLASAGEKSWEIKGWVEHLLEEHRLQDDSNEGKNRSNEFKIPFNHSGMQFTPPKN